MYTNGKRILVGVMAMLLVPSIAALGQGDKTQVSGMISGRSGDSMIVKTAEGQSTIVLDDSTVTQDRTGLFGWGKKEMANSVLIPGLKVKVDGVPDEQGRIVAKTVTVDGDDLETSEMIQAGVTPTAEQVIELQKDAESHHAAIAQHGEALTAHGAKLDTHDQNLAEHKQQIDQNIASVKDVTERFNAHTDYDVKSTTTLKFKVGSATPAKADLEQLKEVAENASKIPGYLIEVKGFADSTGTAAMNTKLSEDRAKAVIAYLIQECNVPIRHIVAPGAMGIYAPVATNETKAGRTENRRVEVSVLASKGFGGKTND